MPHRLGSRARLLPSRRSPSDGATPDARGVTPVAISIRAAVPSDREAVAELYVQLKNHHAALVPSAARYAVTDERWAGMVLDAMEDPTQHIFVAEESGTPVAFVRLFFAEKSFGTACEVETIVVRETHRGRGIGDALLEHAETVARDEGARAMRVNVLDVNDAGRRFYEDRGYRAVAIRYAKDL